MKYSARHPYKVHLAMFAQMLEMRAAGKTYQVIADFCGVSRDCARKWIQARTPKGEPCSAG